MLRTYTILTPVRSPVDSQPASCLLYLNRFQITRMYMPSMPWTCFELELGIRVSMKYFRFRACVIRWPDLCELLWLISHKTQFFPPNSWSIQDPVCRCYSFQLPSGMRILNGWVHSMAVGGSYGLHSSISKDDIVPQMWYLLWLLLSRILSPPFLLSPGCCGISTSPWSTSWCFIRGICLPWCSVCSIQWNGRILDALPWESHAHAWVCLTFWDSPLRIPQPCCWASCLSVPLSLNLLY